MLLKLVDFAKKSDVFARPYKAIVISNDDPRNLGRVKANIPGLIEGDTATLPWIMPWSPVGIGGRGDTSAFSPLSIGSEIIVEFPYKDVYSPFYTGLWQSEVTHNGSLDESYPFSYGFIDEKGNGYKVDRNKQLIDINHSSRTRVQFQKDGTLEIKSKKGVRFISEDDKTELFLDLSSGSFSITPKDTFEIGGVKSKISSTEFELEVGSIKEDVSGSKESVIVGGRNESVGGSDSLAVLSNRATSIGGDSSDLVAGKTEKVYGLGYSGTVVLGDLIDELLAGNRELSILLGNYTLNLTAGNYSVEVIAGNIDIKTNLGTLSFGSNLGSVEVDITGGITIDATTNLMMQALVSATLQAPLVSIGSGVAPSPVITLLSDPIEDFITGKPKFGLPTVLIG